MKESFLHKIIFKNIFSKHAEAYDSLLVFYNINLLSGKIEKSLKAKLWDNKLLFTSQLTASPNSKHNVKT